MTITPEESEAYRFGIAIDGTLSNALRRHVGAEMRLEFEREHLILGKGIVDTWCSVCHRGLIERDPRHGYDDAAWERAADEALRKGKSDG